mmetsp:Transcript_10342/g.9131  ORF Transcript_10342/g.9131 Transcript_10342/m.9131 type:complete len:124 (+) Transcript_10342:1071-1442(+)
MYQSVSEISISKSYFSNQITAEKEGEDNSSDHLSGFGLSENKSNEMVLQFSNSDNSKYQEYGIRLNNETDMSMISSPAKKRDINSPTKDMAKTQGNNNLEVSKAVRLVNSINNNRDVSSDEGD